MSLGFFCPSFIFTHSQHLCSVSSVIVSLLALVLYSFLSLSSFRPYFPSFCVPFFSLFLPFYFHPFPPSVSHLFPHSVFLSSCDHPSLLNTFSSFCLPCVLVFTVVSHVCGAAAYLENVSIFMGFFC